MRLALMFHLLGIKHLTAFGSGDVGIASYGRGTDLHASVSTSLQQGSPCHSDPRFSLPGWAEPCAVASPGRMAESGEIHFMSLFCPLSQAVKGIVFRKQLASLCLGTPPWWNAGLSRSLPAGKGFVTLRSSKVSPRRFLEFSGGHGSPTWPWHKPPPSDPLPLPPRMGLPPESLTRPRYR